MKIGRYRNRTSPENLGIVVGEEGSLKVFDLGTALQARFSGALPFGNTMAALMNAGPAGLAACNEALAWALREGERHWFVDEAQTDWLVPVKVRHCIAGGRNFGAHMAESMEYWKARGVQAHTEMPMGFIKLASAMVPTRSTVQRPPETAWFDYEIEATAVIGCPAERVSVEQAMDCVFGYTILNDLSARELQRKEMANQSILLGKNFPGLGPLGPWILTADEVPDPSVLSLELRVNGEIRQQAKCTDLIFSFPEMIAHWSRMGLDQGDLITTGSPEGVAISRPDPMPFYLQPGDHVEATIAQIGTLYTHIA